MLNGSLLLRKGKDAEMSLVNMKDMLNGIMEAAAEMRSPIILTS